MKIRVTVTQERAEVFKMVYVTSKQVVRIKEMKEELEQVYLPRNRLIPHVVSVADSDGYVFNDWLKVRDVFKPNTKVTVELCPNTCTATHTAPKPPTVPAPCTTTAPQTITVPLLSTPQPTVPQTSTPKTTVPLPITVPLFSTPKTTVPLPITVPLLSTPQPTVPQTITPKTTVPLPITVPLPTVPLFSTPKTTVPLPITVPQPTVPLPTTDETISSTETETETEPEPEPESTPRLRVEIPPAKAPVRKETVEVVSIKDLKTVGNIRKRERAGGAERTKRLEESVDAPEPAGGAELTQRLEESVDAPEPSSSPTGRKYLLKKPLTGPGLKVPSPTSRYGLR
ncbi:hypothetical protein NEDG_00189 [Nematocida displodere]|uniref:Uncharacterized protein n=1 Tax=Nematocida displodere TaxID=1805483 RepID=A0A177EIB1_9MICR|nr:hypothetical protein NEDG_00189 [Nematocida displodere]